jgi:hypothetical protein
MHMHADAANMMEPIVPRERPSEALEGGRDW